MAVDMSVQLRYVVTWREISDGLKIQMRHSPAGRWCYRALWGLGALLGLVTVAGLLTGGTAGLGMWPFLLIVCVLLVAVRWLTALALLAYARHLGEHRVTVDEDGISAVSERHTNRTDWGFYGRGVESRRVFVLITPDVWGTGVLILPKSGLAGAQDTERLRSLITEHLAAGRPRSPRGDLLRSDDGQKP
ncbi:YcxB family protein [Streptomyces sp. NBC_01725]|uniref:YcxB family protein n=1 Tax=Streptomyces sp. NBC_01725 TaxID=2975923 RepID=UPI002E2E5FEB|nr:YcxB family protein [Streptomyces sp. NBC_01725]